MTASDVELVIPVHNEERGLEASIRYLHAYLTARARFTWRITIADNASTDATLLTAIRLTGEFADVHAVHLARKGRGRALRATWLASRSPVVAYMDVDLSTDLAAFALLVEPLLAGDADVAIGTRLARGSQVTRGPKRETISRIYNALLRASMGATFSDAQCGFKAVRRDVAAKLVPLIEDDAWFFDTELLLLAQHNNMRVHEVPVRWVDDPDSRVDIVATALEDLRGMWRMRQRFAHHDGLIPIRQTPREGRPAAVADAI